ncbi:MAG TPA: LamG domain-containing protein [Sedimentisphaerales bacterium]|nr:LamG domain-containing protein [Sedimentisphaerales bacterium]
MCNKMICLVCFVLVLGVVSNASADLVAHWPLDVDAKDIFGGHDGTLVGGAQFTDDPERGRVLSVDGVDGHIEVPHDDDMVFSSADSYTIMAWIYLEALPGSWQTVIAKSRDQGTHYGIWITDSSEWMGGGWENRGSPAVTQVWVHIAYVQDGAEGTGVTYIDGAVDWSGGPRDGTGAGDFWIGGAGSVTEFLRGMIDEVWVYNHALTEEEIQTVMLSGGEGYPFPSRPNPADGALHPDTWVNLSWTPGALTVSHDVYFGDNFDDVSAGAESTFQGNQTTTFLVAGFPGFPYPDGLVPGTTYYWRIDEVNDTEPNSPWKGEVWSFSIPPKTAYYPDPADGAELVNLTANLSWTAGFGAKLHTVFFGDNFDDVSNATEDLPQGTTTYTPGPLKTGKTYYWRVDEFDIIETFKGEVWSFTTQGAVGSLKPSNGAVDVKQTQILTWSPGEAAASHEVYFGTDKEVVRDADTSSPEYKGTRDLGSESYDPGKLEWDVTYYWRIDEVNNTNADSPWIGPVWSFTTADFLIVDDFESYNDLDPAVPESNRIFNAWIDGYDDPTNGSLVGYDAPPFAEQTIVHGGNQSIPLFYDNSVGYSEATLTLTYPRDWTEKGVSTLTVWFRGNSDNAAETLYVALNGSAVVSHDKPDAAQINEWTQWNIDLQAFADQGVDLTNVNTIALGLGNKNNPQAGGSGTMYFDDIRLYAPELEAP